MRYEPQALIWALLARNAAAFNAAKNAPNAFYSALQPCPAACDGTPENWTVYSSLSRLEVCTEPMLLDFAIFNALDNPNTSTKLRTCTAGNAKDTHNGLLSGSKTKPHKRGVKYTFKANACTSATGSKVDFDLTASSDQGQAGAVNLQAAIQNVQNYMLEAVHCGTKFLVGYSQGAAVAVYSGAAIDNGQTIPSVLQEIENKFHGESPSNAIVQLCGKDRNADYTFGVAIDTTGNLAAVQKAIASWTNGTCFGDGKSSSTLSAVSVFEAPLIPVVQNTTAKGKFARALKTRSDCTTVTVVSGDSCGSLASKCGISAQSLSQFNPSSTLCSALQPGQRVCCTVGTLPDLTPKQNANGTCATYTVQSGDSCSTIAVAHSLTAAQIETFNDKTTWGWAGCTSLFAGTNICLSTGNPPLPAPVPNSLCGPLVPGSAAPASGQSVASLNPCPLNSCCDVWGQCGITPAFCTASLGPTGNPGTAPPGLNGCISNCGTNIANNGAGPGSYLKVGYYEAFNWDRPCLHYAASDLAGTDYTNVHWGFASVDSDFNIVIDDTYNQLPGFLALPQKKMVSFGGWGFSTDPTTFEILRSAMTPQNVNTFVNNIVAFLKNGWDGIDIDWEYPGAPDIPGIPPGLPTDGPNYLSFLTKLRAALGTSKTISIASPASYWYLKAFPIADMAKQVDYIVYMTYDLHGQWDYGSQFSQDGCLAGNCLRSHVNLTETMYSLAMITKAGVPTNKITVGVSSYGRSFGLTNKAACQSSLTNAGCTFVGPNSGATPGECTVTAGYISNAEINEILGGSGAQYVFDTASNSDMMFYGNNWVAWMTDTTKNTRISTYKGLNMAGTADWAVDLQAFTDDSANPGGSGGGGVIYYPPSIWQSASPSISCDDCTIVLPPSPLKTPVAVTYTVTTTVLISQAGTTFTELTTFALPPFTVSSVPFWPITVQSGASLTTFTPIQSVMPPSQIISLPSGTIIAPPRSGTYQPIQTYATPTTAPGPTPSNSNKNCAQWYQDASGDTCSSIAQKWGIAQNQFVLMNPSLGSSCSLVVGDWYCVQQAANGTVIWLTSPIFASTSITQTIQPPPTQSVNFPPVPPIVFFPPPPGPPPEDPVCTTGCGTEDCLDFGCNGGCGKYGCDGGCGVGFCGGGCRPGECGPGCGAGDCSIDGGGGGVFPPPGPPPPIILPPTADGEYAPPAVPCRSLGDPIVIPPGFTPNQGQPQDGPGEASDSDFDDDTGSGSGSGSGNPPITSKPSSTPTSSKGLPGATTITTNGEVCTLIQGSNDPICTPLTTPTANPSGTNVHVNAGCVLINGSPRCAGNEIPISQVYPSVYNVASTAGQAASSALILYGYDASNPYSLQQTATCQMNAQWPSNFGDVFLGADGHLYDASSNQISTLGCATPDPNNDGPTINPYRDPRPAGACDRTDDVLAIGFSVYAKGWVTDGGAALKKQVSGCGLVTVPKSGTVNTIKQDGSNANIGNFEADFEYTFALPDTFKAGCVGRAMVSAGAPAGSYC